MCLQVHPDYSAGRKDLALTGNPLLLKLANASGPFKNEAIQYCVLICSNSLPAVSGLAAI